MSAVAAGALLLTGCGSAGGGGDDEDAGAGEATAEEFADTITIGIEQTPDAYNSNTADANSVYNTYVNNITQSDFVKVQPDGTVEPNEALGTYEKTSDDPLTVEYTFADDAVWSDGTPIDFDDALLAWAAYSGTHPSGETDADGNPVDLFNAASTNGWAEVEMPEGEAGDKSFTMVFKNPYADWEVLGAGFMPAHIAAEQGGLSVEDDGAALVDAITNNDTAALTPVAEFWNTGWAYQANLPELPDPALIPSSGPYKLDNASNGTLTLVRNDQWFGEEAKTETIVFKTVDANEMVQALQNGEIDQFDPSNATKDMLDQLEALGDTVEVETGESLTFSHIDLDTSATGVFNDQRVRQAFAKCVPREELVDKFARPVYPEAQVLKLHEILPAQAEYEEAVTQVPSANEYDEVDLEGAKALLAEAGVTTPLTVRFTFSEQSSLRADQVALVKASCDQAGFNIEAKPDPDVFTSLASAPGTWDAAVFGWAGSGLIASGQSIYITGGNQNYGKYTNPEVDRIWGELVQVTDPADALPLQIELEEQLWSNLYNVTLYANPGMSAWSSSLEGPVYNPTQYGGTWNAETWTKSLS
ncbi:peptide ABC transporter substrate-binding protein [Cellulomonas aerilata]|uniref:Peptide ABC transporter substrate-binding protein n=1 Tax=Cellulomonas aerilata TaxID=515326 RepID=A0A512DDZ5_9CELL|nr:peptide ABC transporter substrate-binding protein [Cellulomonas aerilata]